MSPIARAAWESWSAPLWPTALLLATAAVYVRGWRRLGRLRAGHYPVRRLVFFLAGLAAIGVAIASPLDAFAGLLLSAHMTQHLLLMAVAPPLLLLGAPQAPLLRGLPRAVAREALGPFLASPALARFGHRLTHPLVGLSAMTLAMWGWHVPAAYELALRSPGWHEAEHASFLLASLLFWWPVVLPWPGRAWWPAWTTPLYLLAGDVSNTVLAAIMTFSDRVLYPTYDAVPRLFGLSALADQSLAGSIMWVPGSLAFLAPAVYAAYRLLSPAGLRRATPHRPRGPAARPPAPKPFDLLRAPIVGALLRSRWGRRALQAVSLVLAALVIADGLAGPAVAPINAAAVIPWTYGRGLLVIALLAAGNVFCMACPFTLPREIGKRLGQSVRAWPRVLRSKWLAAALLASFFWAYEAFDLWDRPAATAGILVGYFAAAFAVDTFFRGASFCKYVCPIGQFQFVGSLVSPLEVRVRRPEACATCTTHDCIRGNAAQRGCELELFLPRKSGSVDCTFCLDCVKACPHEAIGILPVLPARELVRDAPRSSVGRFAERPDLAALALVFSGAAFANAFAMVRPGSGSLFAVAVAAALIAAAGLSPSGLRPRLALALVPLGLSMWAGHWIFHLATGWASAGAVVGRVFPRGGLGASVPASFVSGRSLLSLELLLLDAGLLLSLYVAWRVARPQEPRPGRGVPRLAPFLPIAMAGVALWLSGVWIFLQPMPMRGMAGMVH